MTGVHEAIDTRQLDPESGRLLRAFTAEYRRAKRYRGARLIISTLLAIAGPLLGLWSVTAAGVVGAFAGLWVLVARLGLVPLEEARVRCAVVIQERFDTRLFGLAWPSSLAGPGPHEEDIADAERRLRDDERVSRQHRDGWFPSTVGLPWPVNVLVAQWSSAAYGRRQHHAYARFIVAGLVVGSIGVIGVGVLTGMSLTDWLITFLLPGLPALLDISELAQDHHRLSTRKQKVEARIRELWESELASPGSLDAADCRAVQDETFRLRAGGRQIPDWFYWLHRGRNESNMQDAAAARRAQFNAARSPQGSPAPSP